MVKLQAGYMAGIFDGEGTVGVYQVVSKNKTKADHIHWHAKLAITGLHMPMIRAFYETMKCGSLAAQKRQAIQRTPTRDYDPALCRQGWRWTVTDKDGVKKFLTTIRPFLMEKEKQVDIVLRFLSGDLEGKVASKGCKKAKQFEFKRGAQRDVFSKKMTKGESNPFSKMTERKVRRLRHLSKAGESYAALARKFLISTVNARRIALNHSWKHVS